MEARGATHTQPILQALYLFLLIVLVLGLDVWYLFR